jgi:hypothetical protein
MTDRTLSLAAEAALNAVTLKRYDVPYCACPKSIDQIKSDVAAALRATVAHTQLYQGNDCLGNEIWTCDADELLAIATELENQ